MKSTLQMPTSIPANAQEVEDRCCDCGGGSPSECKGCDNELLKEMVKVEIPNERDLCGVKVSAPNLERENIILEIYRNRSEMEAQLILKDTGEIVDRIPVEWKARENQLDYLSVSKISAYEQCPACFYKQYIAEETKSVDNGNFFTKFGSILHEVCENVMKIYRDNGIVVDPTSLLNESWRKYNLQGFEHFDQARTLIVDYFNANPVDSRAEFPVLIEEEWRGELGGTTFGLILDYAGIMKNNPVVGILRDYKSNRMPFTSSELQNSLQLRIYELVLRRHLMPQIEKWNAGYDLFFHGWQQCPQWSMDDLLRAEDYVANIWTQITNDNVWEERLNTYCGYRECRHTCSKYQNFMKNANTILTPIVKFDNTNIEDVEKQRKLMQSIVKISDGRKKECEEIIKAEIEHKAMNNEKLIIDGSELSLFSQSKSSYRYDDVKNVLLTQNKLNMLDGCLSITKTKFDAKVKADANMRLQLASCMSTNYSSPYIVSKKA